MAKVGRPPRISRQAIAEAANAVGLSDLTLRAVADHLGVSVASLYHHVDSKDDLLRLAAEYSAARTPLPQDHGQHWSIWLLEWAFYNRDAFAAEPALLNQYLDGAISPEVIAENTDAILAPLMAQGFGPTDAQAAYLLVANCALGSAVNAIREQRAAAAGDPTVDQYRRVLAQRPDDELPHLRALVAEAAHHPVDSFETRITTALMGIATRRGEDGTEVAARVERVLTAHA